ESRGSVLYIVLASAALVTTAVLLLRIAGACIWMKRMRLDATPAPHAVQKACSGLASQLRVPAPTVLVSGEVNSPCLVGILHPAVVLPEVSMTSSQLRYVLYHELAHLARRDGLWNLAGRVMRAAFFFQPLINVFTSKMEWVNDEIADDYVVLMGGGGADYAEQLTSVAERCLRDPSSLACAGVMAFNCSLGHRVQRILNSARPMALYVARPVAVAIAAAGLVAVAATALLFGTAGGQQPGDEEAAILGRWQAVDFVDSPAEFKPGKRQFRGDLYLKQLDFLPNGRTSGPWSWDNGYLYHPGDQSKAQYTTKTIRGKRYLFMEWMSGDVLIRGQKPSYYVLEYQGALEDQGDVPPAPVEPAVAPGAEKYHAESHPPFVNDRLLVGKWQTVDFVDAVEAFDPENRSWQGEFYLKDMEFMPGGRTSGPWSWSNGTIYHPGDKSLAHYVIQDIAGQRYLLFEWISGDVSIRGMAPKYYVLKYVGASTAPAAPADVKINPADYISEVRPAFVDDPYVIGRWVSVDFVSEMADFEPGVKKWPSGLFLTELIFHPKGRLTSVFKATSGDFAVWTNGAVWHRGDHTLSRYTLTQSGADLYMFFEWVSGDVTIRAMKPHYYVLKRAQ
ncbi:MAG: M56 family metallopeptidase, partial [Candidatus Hydrogenedentes bacterium]|nr:M56 family metallopeptidase [Candidatus Hydrogenedentota bacterium]